MSYKYHGFISYSHAADGKLAPKLQVALEKFAKPWYKLRNLNVFRDEASLSASPHLWSNIQEALDNSEHLLYMASPRSAASKWVRLEIDHFLESHDLDKLIIVLTDGEIQWDESKDTFKNIDDNALPPNLEERFNAEPFYIDLRTAKTQEDISLKNPIFKKEVLKLAAHLHGKAPKDMAGEEVLAHRRMLRVRNSAIAALVFLLFLSLNRTCEAKKQTKFAEQEAQRARDSSKVAQEQRRIAEYETQRARDSSEVAQEQRKIAQDSSRSAQEQRDIAVEQTKIALRERNIAQANALISEAQRETNPTLAILNAKEALLKYSSPENRSVANKIYRAHNFSKSLVISQALYLQDSIAFLPDNEHFITYGDMSTYGVYDWVGITRDDQKLLEGTHYRIWSMSGQPLRILNRSEVAKKYPGVFKSKNKSNIGVYHDALYIKLYDKTSLKLIGEIRAEGFADKLVTAKLSPDRSKIIAVCDDGIIRVCHIASGFISEFDTRIQNALVSRWHPNLGEELDFLPNVNISSDGRNMLVSIPGEIQLWDLDYGNVANVIRFTKPKNCISFSDDSENIEILSEDMVYRWPINSDKVIATNRAKLNCDSKPYNPFNPLKDLPNYRIGGEAGNNIYQVDENGNEQCIMAIGFESIHYVGFTPDKNEIFVATSDTLRFYKNKKNNIWNREDICTNNIPIRQFPNELRINFDWVAFSPDGKLMATISSVDEFTQHEILDNEIIFYITLWDMETGEYIKRYPHKVMQYSRTDFNDEDFEEKYIQFSPDSKKLLMAFGFELVVWNCPMNVIDYLKSNKLNSLAKEKRSRVEIRVWD